MKINNLSWGQEIVFIDHYKKKMYPGHIISISTQKYDMDDPYYDIQAECYDKENDLIFNESLRLADYKLGTFPTYCYKSCWCFPNNIRFIEYVKRCWNPNKNTLNKRDYSQYDKFSHDNNQKQLAAKLAPQRETMVKIMEQGYVWVKEPRYIRKQGELHLTYKPYWRKIKNPKINFDTDKQEYYIYIPTICAESCGHDVGLRKVGKTFLLDKPNDGNEVIDN